MNEIRDRMMNDELDFQTFLIGCLSHSKHFQDIDTAELMTVLARDWALSQKTILEQADDTDLLEMATVELEQRKARINRKIGLFEATIKDSGLLRPKSVWENAFECLRGVNGIEGLEIDQTEFNPDNYKKLKLNELKKLIRGTKRTLEDVWPGDPELRQFAHSVYGLARLGI